MTGRRRRGPPCRRFTPLDAAVIAVAVLVSLAKATHDLRRQIDRVGWFADTSPNELPTEGYFFRSFLRAGLVSGSCAWVVLRMIRPRPTPRRLLSQPGASAVATAVGLLALERLEWLIVGALAIATGPPRASERVLMGDLPWELLEIETSYGYLTERGIGFAVVAAWAALALGRRCRREAGWIDPTGTILGLAWAANSIGDLIGWDRG